MKKELKRLRRSFRLLSKKKLYLSLRKRNYRRELMKFRRRSRMMKKE